MGKKLSQASRGCLIASLFVIPAMITLPLAILFFVIDTIKVHQANNKANTDYQNAKTTLTEKFNKLKELEEKNNTRHKKENEQELQKLLKKNEPELSKKVKDLDKAAKVLGIMGAFFFPLLIPAFFCKISSNIKKWEKDNVSIGVANTNLQNKIKEYDAKIKEKENELAKDSPSKTPTITTEKRVTTEKEIESAIKKAGEKTGVLGLYKNSKSDVKSTKFQKREMGKDEPGMRLSWKI